MSESRATRNQIIEYEISASWWATWISSKRLQGPVGRYFAWKVKRKYRRYETLKNIGKEEIEKWMKNQI